LLVSGSSWWIEADRLGVISDGAIVVALVGVGVSAAAVGICLSRTETDRLALVGNRAVPFAVTLPSIAPFEAR